MKGRKRDDIEVFMPVEILTAFFWVTSPRSLQCGHHRLKTTYFPCRQCILKSRKKLADQAVTYRTRPQNEIKKYKKELRGGRKWRVSEVKEPTGCTIYFQFISIINLYMFRAVLPLIIRKYYSVYTAFCINMPCVYVDWLVARSCQQPVNINV
jgi:hypothetical protein